MKNLLDYYDAKIDTFLSLRTSTTASLRNSWTVFMPSEDNFLWKGPSLPIFSRRHTSS